MSPTFSIRLVAFLIGLLACQSVFAQKQIRLYPGTYTAAEILSIMTQQGLSVVYNPSQLPASVCFYEKEQYTLQALLDQLAACHQLSYRVTGHIVAILPPSPTTRTAPPGIYGIVRDANTGEVLIGATVHIGGTRIGVITNTYGYYSLKPEPGAHAIIVSYLGYESLQDTIMVGAKASAYHFYLRPLVNELREVVVSAKDPDFNLSSLIPGFNTISLDTKGEIPYFLGEVDILQGLTLLPGISRLGEDSNGLNVRGGGLDQNFVLLDEAPVYNPTHLFGLISVFNPEAVNNAEIMKGFIPPAHGGRASSVITIHQKEGNYKNYQVTGGIGLVSARLIAEGPLKRDTSSFMISARQSILDFAFDDLNTTSSFRDFNMKVNWKPNRNNTFYLSGYTGNDETRNIFNTENNWGNANLTARWNHLYGTRAFANYSAVVSQYNYRVSQPVEAASFIGSSRVTDYILKADLGYVINPRNRLEFGGNFTLHRLKPGERIPFEEGNSSSNPIILDTEHGMENAFYVSHEFQHDFFSAWYGLRFSSLHYFGPGTVNQYADSLPKSTNSIVTSSSFEPLEVITSYYNPEPRISLNFRLSNSLALKTSYSRTFQYIHLISNTILPAPTDIWKLSDTHIAPTQSDQFSLGLYQNFKQNTWEAYVEGYYKNLSNVLEYKNGADLLFNPNPETELLSGTGRAYGLEFFVKKNAGDFTGWASYTLSRSETRVVGEFPEETINSGNFFPSNHDKRHDFTLIGLYNLNKRLSTSLTFNINSGRPFTPVIGKYEFEGNVIPNYGARNSARLPTYHRADWSLKWLSRTHRKNGSPKRFTDYWTFVIYNVYGRENVHAYILERNPELGTTEVVPYTIFDQIIPAITYHFRF